MSPSGFLGGWFTMGQFINWPISAWAKKKREGKSRSGRQQSSASSISAQTRNGVQTVMQVFTL